MEVGGREGGATVRGAGHAVEWKAAYVPVEGCALGRGELDADVRALVAISAPR